MPIRGRRPRRNAGIPEAQFIESVEGRKEIRLSIRTAMERVPYVQVSIVTNLVSRPGVDFRVGANVVDRKATDFQVGASLVNRSGDTVTASMFAVTTQIGGDTGYPTPPRIEMPRSLVVGQPLRRHREVIQSND